MYFVGTSYTAGVYFVLALYVHQPVILSILTITRVKMLHTTPRAPMLEKP